MMAMGKILTIAIIIISYTLVSKLAVAKNIQSTVESVSMTDNASELTAKGKEAVKHKDFNKAVSMYQQAAKLDDASAMYELGQIYSDVYGYNVVKKVLPNEAEHWYRQGAEHGSAPAMYCIGFLYFNGNHGHGPMNSKDIAESLPWFQKSADLGYAPAIAQLGVYV